MRLRLLAAEIRAELPRIERTLSELEDARERLPATDGSRLVLYGAAALLETFYTGVEKVLTRIASAMGGVPEGQAWHRQVLEDAALDLPKMRPPVLSSRSIAALDPYLAFRHRFRNLYLFDLDWQLMEPLLQQVAGVWRATEADLRTFADALERMAEALDSDS
jgi:hypothetical protein